MSLFFSQNIFAQQVATEENTTEMTEPETGFIDSVLEQGKALFQEIKERTTSVLEGKTEEETTSFRENAPPQIDDPEYLDLGTFVVNLKDGKYFLKTTITLIFSDSRAALWLKERMAIVKDLIINQLSRLTSKKLRKSKVRRLLKNDLKIKINSLFPNNWSDQKPLKKILFQEFYTQ